MSERILLAGDIGGTNTKLAFYSSHQGYSQPLHLEGFRNRDFQSFEDLLDRYLELHPEDFTGICLGIAGAVTGNWVKVTNLGWDIDGGVLRERYDLQEAWLFNDLKALSYAVPQLPEEDLAVIRKGQPVGKEPIAVIAPGTGLGEGFLIWDGEEYRAVSTEGGHADFGPTNQQQIELIEYLQEKGIRVSYEQVCSGIGVPNLYSFLRDRGYAPEEEWLRKEIAASADMTPVIFNHALDGDRRCQLCAKTVELFVSILGAEAGNLALRTLARGGIFIGGGIAPRILPWLRKAAFLEALDDKAPHQKMIEKIPVKVVINPIANLIGAAYYGLQKLK